MAKVPVLRMEIVKRSDDVKGFVVLPRRCIKGRRKGFGCNDGELRGDGLSVSRQGVFTDSLTEILHSGARAVLTQAVEAEVVDFLAKHADLKTETIFTPGPTPNGEP